MRQHFFKALGLAACIGFLSTQVLAQEESSKTKTVENEEEIIIKQKGDKNTKVTVEIKDGEVKVNGKPLSEFKDENVEISKRTLDPAMKYLEKIENSNRNLTERTLRSARSPFRNGTWNVDGDDVQRSFGGDAKQAFLGVISEKNENGAKITRITKGSPAEKFGLKEGDVITRVGDTKIEGPEDLSKAITKFKPEDKALITYQRDNKENKVATTLGKRSGGATYFAENFNFNRDFNFDMGPGGNVILRPGTPRLGIKAQDTEDGKGVKVLDVDDESNADKAGIKEGDILTEFDGKPVNTATELADAAKNAKDKSSIRIKLLRDGKNQEIEVKIPKKLKTANL